MATTKSKSKKKKTSAVSLAGLPASIQDITDAARLPDDSPANITDLKKLQTAIAAAIPSLPPLYAANVGTPFLEALKTVTPAQFKKLLASDPKRQGIAGLLFDIAQSITQPAAHYQRPATRAFQELVSDLYDGFLSAEDRKGVQPPDLGVIPPLVKWGNPNSGPYTWPIDAVNSIGLKAGVVNFPPGNATRGLAAWAAIGHETAGHDILHADSGLQPELARAVQAALAPLSPALATYWADRIDETSSDVMGILNMGPAAGIGLIAYFRGLWAAFGMPPALRCNGSAGDPHPADIVRGYLAAEVVALLAFKDAKTWSDAIASETEKDLKPIVLAGTAVTPKLARQSAQVVARTLVKSKMKALENHALGEIQGWSDDDEALVKTLRAAFASGKPAPASTPVTKIYAAHVVAAAVIEGLSSGKDLPGLQSLMIQSLNALHDTNPSWGPLYIERPGDLQADFFVPAELRV